MDFTSINVFFGRDYVIVKKFCGRGKFLEERLSYEQFESLNALYDYITCLVNDIVEKERKEIIGYGR